MLGKQNIAGSVCAAILLCCSIVGAEEHARELTLDKAIAIALERSPMLTAAALGITEASHRQEAARADFFPKLGTDYSYTKLDEPPEMRFVSTQNSALQSLMTGNKVQVGPGKVYNFRAGLIQPLFTGGALLNQYRLEQLGVDVAKARKLVIQEDIILAVKDSYFTILKAEKMRAVAAQTVKQIQDHERVARNFFEQEMIAKNDLLEAQVRLAQAQQDLIRADNGVALATSALNTVLHQDINTPVRVVDIVTDAPIRLSLTDCQMRALQNRPLLREIDFTIQQAERGVALAKSGYAPKSYLVYNYNLQGDQPAVNGTDFQKAASWDVTVNLHWTFWEWGKTYHQVGEHRIKLQRAQEVRKETVDRIALEVKSAYLDTQETYKNISVARDAIVQAEENFRINKERFDQQMATTTEVLDAQTLLSQAYMNYNNTLCDYNINRAKLEKAIGQRLN
jgi:outer membrane protein TolC